MPTPPPPTPLDRTRTAIANMAAKHLGHSTPMQDIDSDRSAIAHACRTFYDKVVRLTLRDFNWPFATKIVTLDLVSTDPNLEWKYAYQQPSDCAKFRRIQSGFRTDNRNTQVPLRIIKGTSGKLILTDKSNAIGEYTMLISDPNMFDDDFAMALSWRLAVYIAPSITGGDPYKLKDAAWNGYQIELANARANASDEEVEDQEPESEFVYSRM